MLWANTIVKQRVRLMQELCAMLTTLESNGPDGVLPSPFEDWRQALLSYRIAQADWLEREPISRQHPCWRLWAEFQITEPSLFLSIRRLQQNQTHSPFCEQELRHVLLRLQHHLQLEQRVSHWRESSAEAPQPARSAQLSAACR
jgi:hypothetical protein